MYNKLVRDRIPDIIISNGEEPITRVLDDTEFKVELVRKLEEEKNEVLTSSGESRIEELADMLEVMSSLAEIEGYSLDDILRKKEEKKEKRGGFQKKIFLSGVNKKR